MGERNGMKNRARRKSKHSQQTQTTDRITSHNEAPIVVRSMRRTRGRKRFSKIERVPQG